MSTQLKNASQTQLQNWALIIKSCKESGLKVQDYCDQNSISRDTYYYWHGKVKKILYSQNAFVEIPASQQLSGMVEHKNSGMIEICSGSLCIRVPMDASSEVLARIIGVVSHAQ